LKNGDRLLSPFARYDDGMTNALDSAWTFLLNNGRLLERKLFAYCFRGGSSDGVVAALRAYQNDDGGFGNALEPDKRTPSSQPIDQEVALRAMDDVGADADMTRRMCDWLVTVTTNEGGVPFTLPTVNDTPHAPWWETDDPHPPANINPTASIAGLLHRHGVHHPWLDCATDFCWRIIETSEIEEPHALVAVLTFLQHATDHARAERAFARVAAGVTKIVTLDPNAQGYVHRPLEFAPRPNGLARRLFSDDVIKANLDHLQAQQQADGGWPIAWPTLSAANEYEYRGVVTLGAVRTLRAFGRV
jgi:hypothetical protein